jgi:hypothetical protein
MVPEILVMIACLWRRLPARTLFLFLCLLLVLALLACRPEAELDKEKEPPLRFTTIDAFRIPVLATASEQLAHARSDFEEVQEKTAALKAVALLHPNDRRRAAMAALDLAYLEFGADYRLAGERQCTSAMEKYREILVSYSDFPEIAAKSLWYLGWITSDLLGDRHGGLIFYQRIVDEYPHESLNFLPPAPWLTIHRSEENTENRPSYPKPGLTWLDVAHLEIIRNATDRERVDRSLIAIRASHGDDGFTGLALKVLLAVHGFDEQSEQWTRQYLVHSRVEQALKNDLLLALSAHRRETEAKGTER